MKADWLDDQVPIRFENARIRFNPAADGVWLSTSMPGDDGSPRAILHVAAGDIAMSNCVIDRDLSLTPGTFVVERLTERDRERLPRPVRAVSGVGHASSRTVEPLTYRPVERDEGMGVEPEPAPSMLVVAAVLLASLASIAAILTVGT